MDGVREDLLDTKVPFTQNEVHLPTVSIYHNPYELQLPPLTEIEYNKYQYAKALFQMRQFDSVTQLLQNSKSPRLYFLRLYAKYLVSTQTYTTVSRFFKNIFFFFGDCSREKREKKS